MFSVAAVVSASASGDVKVDGSNSQGTKAVSFKNTPCCGLPLKY